MHNTVSRQYTVHVASLYWVSELHPSTESSFLSYITVPHPGNCSHKPTFPYLRAPNAQDRYKNASPGPPCQKCNKKRLKPRCFGGEEQGYPVDMAFGLGLVKGHNLASCCPSEHTKPILSILHFIIVKLTGKYRLIRIPPLLLAKPTGTTRTRSTSTPFR